MRSAFLGIDPGWKNLGWTLLESGKVTGGAECPADMPLGSYPSILDKACKDLDVKMLCMERFVYYAGVHNPDSEHILMVTGQIQHWAFANKVPILMFKAIEWKSALAKHMHVNMGVSNPYDRLDKKFSLWAAKQLLGVEFRTDHEADSACLAWLARARVEGVRG